MCLIVGQEIAACGAAFAGGDHVLVGAIGVHNENLVALEIAAGGLKDEALAVGRPIGFGVFAAIGELFDVGNVGGVEGRSCAGGGKDQ